MVHLYMLALVMVVNDFNICMMFRIHYSAIETTFQNKACSYVLIDYSIKFSILLAVGVV